jgi:acyl transferase domain-containing protein
MQLARDWQEDLMAFSPQVVSQAVKMARRELDYFPTTKQMIELCSRAKGELERWQQRNALPAPEQSFENVCERGLKRIAEIKARLAQRVTV